jgi:L-aminopeptidase/D-esterase-like protein
MRGGIGSAVEETNFGVRVAALVVVNCWGEVVDPDSGRTVAGPRGEGKGPFISSLEVLRKQSPLSPFIEGNSTVAVVATDGVLSKEQTFRLAAIAQTGRARTIRPVHTPVDGDTVFALATGGNNAASNVLQLGALGARAVERAALRAVLHATSLAGVPAVSDWR